MNYLDIICVKKFMKWESPLSDFDVEDDEQLEI